MSCLLVVKLEVRFILITAKSIINICLMFSTCGVILCHLVRNFRVVVVVVVFIVVARESFVSTRALTTPSNVGF